VPEVVTAAATVACVHGAPVVVAPGQAKLVVAGSPALVATDFSKASVPTCPNVATAASPNLVVCGKTAAPGAGTAAGLTVDGVAVLTKDATGTTQGKPDGTWSVKKPGQTVLTAAVEP
jgi:hypothetical protein